MTKLTFDNWLTVLSLATNIGLLIVAGLALCFAKEQATQARRANDLVRDAQVEAARREEAAAVQAADDSRRQTRPYVWLEVQPGLSGYDCWDVTIRNTGRSAARGLYITADWPESPDDAAQNIIQRLMTPRSLAPGAHLRTFWRLPDGGGMPERMTVMLHYGSDDPTCGPFDEACEISIADYPYTPAPQEGATSHGGSDEVKALKNINNALRAMNIHLGELRR